jgi:nitric oxide reductase NorQ protein
VVSYNPGYQNLLKSLKPSTRQRFLALRFDFPTPAREQAIVVGETGCDIATASQLVKLAGAFRALKEHDLDEVPSTRLLVYAAQLIHGGMDRVTACRVALVEALTDDEPTAAALLEVVNASFA